VVELACIAFDGASRQVLKDGVAAQLAADLWHDHQRVGFTFANAELGDVVLDVILVVIVMIRIIELLAARR
jgi:hypothetical protein